jgi:hypothetical protein
MWSYSLLYMLETKMGCRQPVLMLVSDVLDEKQKSRTHPQISPVFLVGAIQRKQPYRLHAVLHRTRDTRHHSGLHGSEPTHAQSTPILRRSVILPVRSKAHTRVHTSAVSVESIRAGQAGHGGRDQYFRAGYHYAVIRGGLAVRYVQNECARRESRLSMAEVKQDACGGSALARSYPPERDSHPPPWGTAASPGLQFQEMELSRQAVTLFMMICPNGARPNRILPGAFPSLNRTGAEKYSHAASTLRSIESHPQIPSSSPTNHSCPG